MNLGNANFIMQRVREAYKSGYKSNNKAYSTTANADLVDELDVEVSALGNPKFQKRYDDMVRDIDRPNYQVSPFETGRMIWTSQAPNYFERGNCLEMAMASIFLAVNDYNADAAKTYYVAITPPGDHAFCLIGASPNWASVSAMSGTGIVIDPWLNICCLADDYSQRATEKLGKWHRNGKRIAVYDDQDNLWWADTAGTYRANFLTAPLSNIPANAVNLRHSY